MNAYKTLRSAGFILCHFSPRALMVFSACFLSLAGAYHIVSKRACTIYPYLLSILIFKTYHLLSYNDCHSAYIHQEDHPAFPTSSGGNIQCVMLRLKENCNNQSYTNAILCQPIFQQISLSISSARRPSEGRRTSQLKSP